MWELPPQCTFWRFLASLHWGVARQLLQVQQRMRERVWEAANVRLTSITLDTDTTVHTLYGHQMGGRKSYNPKNKGKKSYQPILTFLAETREYLWGELRNGDRPTGQQIARHLESVFSALPRCIVKIFARADAGFYCGEAVQAYEKGQASFIIVARKTTRLLAELQSARWQPSPRTDADEQCEFCYQPEGWGKPYRFIALRYQKQDPLSPEREQYQLLDSPRYIYRVAIYLPGRYRSSRCSTWSLKHTACTATRQIQSKRLKVFRPVGLHGLLSQLNARSPKHLSPVRWPAPLEENVVHPQK